MLQCHCPELSLAASSRWLCSGMRAYALNTSWAIYLYRICRFLCITKTKYKIEIVSTRLSVFFSVASQSFIIPAKRLIAQINTTMHDSPWLHFLPRDALIARYVLSSCLRPSVRPSVYPSARLSICPSAIRRYLAKTAKHRSTQTTPYDSPGTLVFCYQRSPNEVPHRGGVGYSRWHSTSISLYLRH